MAGEAHETISNAVDGAQVYDVFSYGGGPRDNLTLGLEPTNDTGNGVRFRARYGGLFINIRNRGWYYWNGRFWDGEDGPDEAEKLAQTIGYKIGMEERPALYAQIAEEEERPEADKREFYIKKLKGHAADLLDWSITSGNAGKTRSLLKQAEPFLRKNNDILDHDPMVINTPSGIIKADPVAQEYTIERHNKDHYCTRIVRGDHDPNAKCPKFLKFLERILPDADERDFLQQWLGYSLTGSQKEQTVVFFTGRGGNGKSVLLDVVSYVMGSYAVYVPIETFLNNGRGRSGSDAAPDKMQMIGARFVTSSEPERGSEFSEKTIKEMTGGEQLAARDLFQKGMTRFYNKAKITLGFNDMPMIKGSDQGTWRRILILKFQQMITDAEKKAWPTLTEDLKAEADGILMWMLEGLVSWMRVGILVPSTVKDATQEKKEQFAPIAVFVEECCVQGEGYEHQSSMLHEAYIRWRYARDGLKKDEVEKIKTFSTIMTSSLGFSKKKASKSFFRGVQLTDAAENEYGKFYIDEGISHSHVGGVSGV